MENTETVKAGKPQIRLDRALDTRQGMQRPTSWRAPEALPSPDDRPGWSHRWVRTSILGSSDASNISSKLRFMDDRTLQKYAAMHKNDPYIFPLAFQESQNRKALEANKAAQMGGQEMPKVNDAALMAMAPRPVMTEHSGALQTEHSGPVQTGLPEEQGIGRLAAPNMQNMADGGIAGFDESTNAPITTQRLDNMGNTGGMFNYAQDGGGVMRMSGGGVPGYRGPTDGEDSDQVTDEFAGVDDQIQANMERQKMLGAFDDYSKPILTPKKGSKAAKKLEEDAKKEEPVKKKVELPPLQTYTASTPADIRRTADEMAKPDLEEIQASYKPFAEQFAQDRSRIESREKTNLSDALIRGGLKALGGKSQYAMQNISEGGLEGLNAYQEGIRTSDAARKALTQSEMLMAQAQRAERQGARRDAVQLTHQAEQAKQTGVQLSNTARQIMGTEAFQQAQTEHFERSDITAGRQADASMVAARAAQTRANALGGTSDDKHMAALTKVQNALNADKEYQEAAKYAKFEGKMGVAARATMERKKRETYRLLAPELLESLDAGKTAPPAGSGGGTNLPPIKSFYY